MCLLFLIGGFWIGVSKPALLALGLFVVVGTLVGLGSEHLILDFPGRRLRYEDRLAGFLVTRIDDGFDAIESLVVNDVSVERPHAGEYRIRPGWALILNYTGPPTKGLTLGVFALKEDAMLEANKLSELTKVPVKELA